MALIQSVIEQGLIYAIMALGVYITYKILDFPDLTVDGSFPMGAAITAALISRGFNSLLTLPICFLAGVLIGALTGLIHVKLKVRDLLSGIIMMTALYTVNLRIAGRANLPIYNNSNIFENAVVDPTAMQKSTQAKDIVKEETDMYFKQDQDIDVTLENIDTRVNAAIQEVLAG